MSKESKYKNLGHLFKNVLNVLPEPTAALYLDYVDYFKNSDSKGGHHRKRILRKNYEALDSLAKDDPQLGVKIKSVNNMGTVSTEY